MNRTVGDTEIQSDAMGKRADKGGHGTNEEGLPPECSPNFERVKKSEVESRGWIGLMKGIRVKSL